jgi:hypothetical protein
MERDALVASAKKMLTCVIAMSRPARTFVRTLAAATAELSPVAVRLFFPVGLRRP